MTQSRISSDQQAASTAWNAPDLAGIDLAFAVGTSVIREFVLGHRPSDVFKEVIQNEFDAAGQSLRIEVGEDALEITGSGTAVDRAGWRRLSVMLGTGEVAGREGENIEPKVSSIGSKNFGIRSLFLFGDQIFVRSAGWQTVLDRRRGTPQTPFPDPSSRGTRGVRISVPYRRARLDQLPSFDAEGVVDDFRSDLAPTLLKLTQPDRGQRLRRVEVHAPGLGLQIEWDQTARTLDSHAKGISALRRAVTVTTRRRDTDEKELVEEMEFQRLVAPPKGLERGGGIPTYFQRPRGRLLLSVSVPTSRRRLADRPGQFYYPIGASQRTGNLVSVCAPFEMNETRTALQPSSSSPWNEWLISEAARLSVDLLTTDWFERFGARAYEALLTLPGAESDYGKQVTDLLASESCWPVKETQQRARRRQRFVALTDLVIPEMSKLDGFLNATRYPHALILGNTRVVHFARENGAKLFTLDSLIRLRAAGRETDHLQTKLDVAVANFQYTDFPNAWRDINLQLRFAEALDSGKASRANLADLREAPTTLNAAGDLAALEDLFVFDASHGETMIPPATRLADRLERFHSFRRLGKKFDIRSWCTDVAGRAATGDARDEEREALYQYLLKNHQTLSPSLLSKLRRLPVFRDHRGSWQSPANITVRAARGTKGLEATLNFPGRGAGAHDIARAFRFRDRLDGADLVVHARYVEDHPDDAETFERLLSGQMALLSRNVVRELASIAFLRSSDGALAAPENLYIRTSELEGAIGPSAPYAASRRRALLLRLGCDEAPLSGDIIEYLAELRESNVAPPQPEILYPALVDALRRERTSLREHEDDAILWTGESFTTPSETLVSRIPAIGDVFRGRVPFSNPSSPRVRDAFLQLGAHREPTTSHWEDALRWFVEHRGAATGRVSQRERSILRDIYWHLDEQPVMLGPDDRWLLADDGTLHTSAERDRRVFLLDDAPDMSAVIREQAIPVWFGDEATRHFLQRVGVSSLTSARVRIGTRTGGDVSPPTQRSRLTPLQRITQPPFVDALCELARRVLDHHPIHVLDEMTRSARSRLGQLSEIVMVDDLSDEFILAGHRLFVPADTHLDGQRLYLRLSKTRAGIDDRLALAAVRMLGGSDDDHRRLEDVAYRLVSSTNVRDMEALLRRKGIAWKFGAGEELEEDDDDEPRDLDAALGEVMQSLGEGMPDQWEGDTPESSPPNGRSGAAAYSPAPGEPDEVAASPPPSDPLPSPDSVTATSATFDHNSSFVHLGGSGGRGGGDGWWRPRSDEERRQDEDLGAWGEEIVFSSELERVRAFGGDDSLVAWISRANPAADHDIRSIDEKGNTIWLEVKSTRGRDGTFTWPISEFRLAAAKRRRYVLVRVYDAGSMQPIIARLEDPLGKLAQRRLMLDIDAFTVSLPPLSSGD